MDPASALRFNHLCNPSPSLPTIALISPLDLNSCAKWKTFWFRLVWVRYINVEVE
ncbi:MAG: hypothetical protein DDT30_01246 [Dehalococcoidia bacterium]|nr:hypothetical protein [Bacillota bacterium]